MQAIGGRGDEAVVIQRGENGVGKGRAAARIGLLRRGLEVRFHIGELHVELRLGEAILFGPAHFLRCRGERACPFAVLRSERDRGAERRVAKIVGAHAAAHDDAVGLRSNALDPAIERADGERVNERFGTLGLRVRRAFPGAEIADRGGIGNVRVGEHFDFGRTVQIDRSEVQRRTRGAFTLPVAEPLADLRLHRLHVEIADHDQRGVFGAIIALPQRLQPRCWRVLQHIGGADRQTAGIGCIGCDESQLILHIAQPHAVAGAHFAHDDPALTVHRAWIEGEIARHFAHEHHGDVHGFLVGLGQIELVDGLFEPGRRVGVRTEGQAVALQNGDHLALGHVLRSVERHMLDEVGEALFLIGLGDRAEVDRHADRSAVLGRVVLLNGVFHAVGQHAEGDRRIGRHIGQRCAPAGCAILAYEHLVLGARLLLRGGGGGLCGLGSDRLRGKQGKRQQRTGTKKARFYGGCHGDTKPFAETRSFGAGL